MRFGHGVRGRGRVAALAVVALAVGGLVACSASDEATGIELGLCNGADGPSHPERCGTLVVPLDWDDPEGEQLELEVLVVPAQGDQPAPDPLFYLAGFGGSAPWNAQWPYDHLKAILDSRDLIFVGQRGTGTTAQTCDLPNHLVTDMAVVRDAVDACLASLDRDPRHDTTANAVRDLDRARELLGYETVDLYGGSYGVSMGLAYLQAYPQRVRSAVFESGSLLDTRLWQVVPTSAQQAFDEVAFRCEADPVCGPAYDPAGDLAALISQVTARPVEVDLGGGPLTIGPVLLLNAIIDDYLGTPRTAARLPADLAAMARGEWVQVLSGLASGDTGGEGPPTVADLMPTQVQTVTLECSDEWAQVDPAVAEQAPSLFVAPIVARGRWQQAVCPLWPHDDGVGGPVETDVPVLFLNGTADPADPPANVAAAADRMPNATLVSVPGGGHGVLDNACLLSLTQRFVLDAAPADDAEWQSCLDDIGAHQPPFPAS